MIANGNGQGRVGEVTLEIDGPSYNPGCKERGFGQAVALVHRLADTGVVVRDALFSQEEPFVAGLRARTGVPLTARLKRGRLQRLQGDDR